MQMRDAVLLINLGTPKSPTIPDVHRYLAEFLTDKRVIDLPWMKRQLLVRGIIIPTRCRQSTSSYQQIWMPEGSPLLVYSQRVKENLQHVLGDTILVEMAMRYQEPSIKDALTRIKNASIDRLLIFPMFPQYASATTGSVQEKVMEIISQWEVIPEISFVDQFATHPDFIEAFRQVAAPIPIADYDHVLFSFHGLPQRHLIKADSHGFCLKNKNCCQVMTNKNKHCYSAQCYATAQSIAQSIGISPDNYTVAFQSRLGKDPWLEPYTIDMLHQMLDKKIKKLLVFSPAFVCDCLETIFEIAVEYREEFIKAGGEKLDLVPGLNDHPAWIAALEKMIVEHFKRSIRDCKSISGSNTRGNYDSLTDRSSHCCRLGIVGDRDL